VLPAIGRPAASTGNIEYSIMRFAALLPVIVLLCAACGGGTPTSPSSTTTANAVERFDDIIDPKESKFQLFSVGSNGVTSINLASLSPIDRPGVLTATMEIGWGKTVKDDDGNVIGCNLGKVLQTTPALKAQLTDTLTPAADYCANIADVGGLHESVNFSIRISHP
jgi:hypothetical protein